MPATSAAKAMLLGENVGFVVSPVVPTIYLAIGLAGVDLGRHIRYALPWLWLLSLCMLGVAVATGAVVVG